MIVRRLQLLIAYTMYRGGHGDDFVASQEQPRSVTFEKKNKNKIILSNNSKKEKIQYTLHNCQIRLKM